MQILLFFCSNLGNFDYCIGSPYVIKWSLVFHTQMRINRG